MDNTEFQHKMIDGQARTETKLGELRTQFTNHLRHHWAVTIVLLGSTISLIGCLIGVVVKLVLFT